MVRKDLKIQKMKNKNRLRLEKKICRMIKRWLL